MIPTKAFIAFAAVFVVVTLSLLVAVNDQRQAIYEGVQKTSVSPSFMDSFVGSAWAEEVTDNTLFVSGSATATSSPDKVTIQFSVTTSDSSAQVSQQENAQLTAAVRSALIAKGISADDIETTGYSLYMDREYNYETRTYIEKGYKTVHSMKVEMSDTTRAGELIDAAISGGANSIDGIYFGLSESKLQALSLQALEAAGANANEKAGALAEGLGVEVTRLMSASEGYTYSPSPVRSYTLEEAAMDSAGSGVPTEVTPGQISVSATINAVYEIA